MSIGAQKRIAGRFARMRVIEDFVQSVQTHPGVSCMRKMDIASYAITSARTVRENI
jgi:hypothetical protein